MDLQWRHRLFLDWLQHRYVVIKAIWRAQIDIIRIDPTPCFYLFEEKAVVDK